MLGHQAGLLCRRGARVRQSHWAYGIAEGAGRRRLAGVSRGEPAGLPRLRPALGNGAPRSAPGNATVQQLAVQRLRAGKTDLPVDYVSGDIYDSAVLAAMARGYGRYFAAVGKPWDLMLWGWQRPQPGIIGPIHKPAVQIKQESTPILSQGGGFQIYYGPSRAGKIDDRVVGTIAEVAEFCRARQAVCHKTETVPQIGLLFSKNTLYTKTNQMFGGWARATDPLSGLLDALVESHYSVDSSPTGNWRRCRVLSAHRSAGLVQHRKRGEGHAGGVREGGRPSAAGRGRERGPLPGGVGSAPGGRSVAADRLRDRHGSARNAAGVWQDVEPAGAQVLEERYPVQDATRDGKCAATLNTLGSGSIAAIYGSTGKPTPSRTVWGCASSSRASVARMFKPMVEVQGPPTIEVALRRKDGRLLVHLSNCTGMQVAPDFATIDYVPQ